MAVIDAKNGSINAKLVYYGPGLCGKTANLQYVSSKLVKGQEIMSLATEGDRTIFFDFMPLELGEIRGLSVKFKLYTVPGQVRYNQTRKMVLKNVDGIVFVADSQKGMSDSNLESFENLFTNLGELRIDPAKIPIVLQYNKRDLPNVYSREELDQQLNGAGYDVYLASAITGEGVVDTLKGACRTVIRTIATNMGVAPPEPPKPPVPTRLVERSPLATPADGSSRGAVPTTANQPAAPQARVPQTGGAVGMRAVMQQAGAAAASISDVAQTGPVTTTEPSVSAGAAAAAKATLPRQPSGIQPAAGARSKESVETMTSATQRIDQLERLVEKTIATAAAQHETIERLCGAVEALLGQTKAPAQDGVLAPLAAIREQVAALAVTNEILAKALPPQVIEGLRADIKKLGETVDGMSPQKLAKRVDIDALHARLEKLPTRDDVTNWGRDWQKTWREGATPTDTTGGGADPEAIRGAVEAAIGPAVREALRETLEATTAKIVEGQLAGLREQLPTKSDLNSLAKKLAAARTDAIPTDATAISADVARQLQQATEQLWDRKLGGLEARLMKAVEQRLMLTQRQAASSDAAAEEQPLQGIDAPSEAEAASGTKGEVETAPAVAIGGPTDVGVSASEAPASEAPASEAPASEAPASEAPASKTAASQAPDGQGQATEGQDDAAEGEAAEAADGMASASEAPASKSAASQASDGQGEAAEGKAGEGEADGGEAAEAADGMASASEAPAAEDDLADDPEHKNAARVARVMMSDLYLYNRDAVEAGIREGDFFERNEEAITDMRTTYESRVPEHVRARKDHLADAISAFLAKKRKQMGLD